MGATRQAFKHIFEKCQGCEYRDYDECTYIRQLTGKADVNNRPVWCRKGKKLNCPREAARIMNAEEQIVRYEGATNGDMVLATFPHQFEVRQFGDTVILERFEPHCKMQFHIDWWNAAYQVERQKV